ncbi:MAG: hypothetical protein ACI9W2_003270 [Gammaproteobacteria bacterium]|jgi:hypothetical protein
MARDLFAVVREMCFSFPETDEVTSHGAPNFRVAGKSFAMLSVNHHGDGRVALWLRTPASNPDHFVLTEPVHYFVPPYLGPRGWLGVDLTRGISLDEVMSRLAEAFSMVMESYRHFALKRMIKALDARGATS